MSVSRQTPCPVPSEVLAAWCNAGRQCLTKSYPPTAKLEAYEGDPNTKHGLQFLMLTATRPGETRGAVGRV